MSIRFKEKERRRNYFSCMLYVINTLMDYLSYLIQDDFIIKQAPLVSSLKMCKRVTNSVKMKGPCPMFSVELEDLTVTTTVVT